jgi:hypothetical protein
MGQYKHHLSSKGIVLRISQQTISWELKSFQKFWQRASSSVASSHSEVSKRAFRNNSIAEQLWTVPFFSPAHTMRWNFATRTETECGGLRRTWQIAPHPEARHRRFAQFMHNRARGGKLVCVSVRWCSVASTFGLCIFLWLSECVSLSPVNGRRLFPRVHPQWSRRTAQNALRGSRVSDL